MDGKVATFATMPLFHGWSLTELRQLAKVADKVDLAIGERLIRAGAWRAGCYVLLSGAVVTTTDEGSRLIATTGEFVGLPETLANAAARGESVALRESTVLAFTFKEFATALDDIRSLRQLALQELAVAQLAPRRPEPRAALALC
jgi:CRP-like cAMP-binding protein